MGCRERESRECQRESDRVSRRWKCVWMRESRGLEREGERVGGVCVCVCERVRKSRVWRG